jgi:inhibitor of cysteine peptidase
MKMKKTAAITICFALTLALLAGAAPRTGAATAARTKKAGIKSSVTIQRRSSYAAICEAVKKAKTNSQNTIYSSAASLNLAEKTADGTGTSAAPTDSRADASSDYSKTNTQVSGVDEGDIVKTDGRYIYALHDSRLLIFKADGTATAQVSSTALTGENDRKYASELYISGSRLIAVMSSYDYYLCNDVAMSDTAVARPDIGWPRRSETTVAVYDVSDPAAPKLMSTLGQDGSLLGTRLADGKLYVVSNYWVYSEVDQTKPGTFVPQLYRNGTASAMPAEKISMLPSPADASYAVVCAYDIGTAALSNSLSVLGSGSIIYMNAERLYLAEAKYGDNTSSPRTDGVYTVTDHNCSSTTQITRIGLKSMDVQSAGVVPGTLKDSYSMDELNGYLRVATTNNTYTYSIYADDKQGFENYKDGSQKTVNALYVLDSGLNIVGRAENVAPGESIYSVRFDGVAAYICTFRQIDPLFAYDLSNPTRPVKLGELKLPGFSEYLHVWSAGRLFGLGQSATEEGRVTGMKLVMFDVSDKANVSAAKSLELGEGYSAALYDPHAILISPDRNLIGFPMDSGYALYSYTDEGGFTKLAAISGSADNWDYNMRGAYIGNFLYIVGNSSVTVIDLSSYATVASAAITD